MDRTQPARARGARIGSRPESAGTTRAAALRGSNTAPGRQCSRPGSGFNLMCQLFANDFPNFCSRDRLLNGSGSQRQSLVDEGLVALAGPFRFSLESIQCCIVEVNGYARLAASRQRCAPLATRKVILLLHRLSAPSVRVCEPKSAAHRRRVQSRPPPSASMTGPRWQRRMSKALVSTSVNSVARP